MSLNAFLVDINFCRKYLNESDHQFYYFIFLQDCGNDLINKLGNLD